MIASPDALTVRDTTPLAFPDQVAALESRAGVDSLEQLHDTRRGLIAMLAPLKALHGHNGLFDDRRKQLLEVCKVRARMELTQDGGKATDNAVEARGYADPQYERFLDTGYDDRIACINLQNEVDEISERIKSREIELMAFSAEVRLQR